ncbi:MAG: YqgE/AlgH family protein [Hyphomicrobiaceae bacterium]
MPINRKSASRDKGYLEGQLLVAMPTMTDRRFARTVIYMCAHSSEGAMGLIINKEAKHISFEQLLEQLSIETPLGDDDEPGDSMPVHVGGPVEQGRGFVLHSSDYNAPDSTLVIDDEVSLTATLDILKAIAGGNGPRHAILALGYSGWGAGQLESEIQANGWLHCPADPDLVFGVDLDEKYDEALSRIGIDPSFLASEAGHA